MKDIKLGTLIALMVEEGEDPSQVEVPTESAPPPTMAEGTGGDEAQWEGGHAGVGSRSEGSSVEEKLPLASSRLALVLYQPRDHTPIYSLLKEVHRCSALHLSLHFHSYLHLKPLFLVSFPQCPPPLSCCSPPGGY